MTDQPANPLEGFTMTFGATLVEDLVRNGDQLSLFFTVSNTEISPDPISISAAFDLGDEPKFIYASIEAGGDQLDWAPGPDAPEPPEWADSVAFGAAILLIAEARVAGDEIVLLRTFLGVEDD
jgi:hypothetical protein